MDVVRDIVINVILLFGLVFMVSLTDQKHNESKLPGKVLFGIVIGFITIIVMMNGFQLESGVIYDTRSVLIAVTGLFFSSVTSIIAAIIAIGYRIYLGGDGVYAGVLTIFFSIGIALLWKSFLIKKIHYNRHIKLYLFGLSIHIAMLLSQLAIPYPKSIEVLVMIGPVVLIIYPIATMLVSLAIINHDDRVEAQQIIKKSEEKYRTLVNNSQLGIIQFNREGVIQIANKAFTDILESDRKTWIGKNLYSNNSEITYEALEKCLSGNTTIFEDIHVSPNRDIPLRIRFSPIYDQKEVVGGIGIIEDLTKQYNLERDIKELQRKDILTKLYNRAAFDHFLFSEQEESVYPISIVTFDINTFQIINTSFGYEVGNEVLVEIAKVFLKEREENRNYKGFRIGGDEFALVMLQTEFVKAFEVSKRIEETVKSLDKFKFSLNMSSGVSTVLDKDSSIIDTFNNALKDMANNKIYAGSSISLKTIDLIMSTLFAKSVRERMHSERVSLISKKIAEKYKLGTAFTNRVALAGKLHDIGKITVSEDILDKPGKLSEAEYSKIKKHSETGFKILSSVSEYLDIANVVLSHHERWDGLGYPRGLRNHEAPLESRIINVADAFDAMTVDRPYRKAFTTDRAVQELKDYAGKQFDPDVVNKFIELYEQNEF